MPKEGKLGRSKITKWTRYLMIIPSRLVLSFGIAEGLEGVAARDCHSIPGFVFEVLTIPVTNNFQVPAFIMWLPEGVSERSL